jgi:hypothetical protein
MFNLRLFVCLDAEPPEVVFEEEAVETAGEEPASGPAQALYTRLHTHRHSSQSTVRLPTSVVDSGDGILGH